MIVAPELITGGNERHRVEPMARLAEAELTRTGIEERTTTVLADAGYRNSLQIRSLEAKGATVFCPPDADTSRAPTRSALAPTTSGCETGSRSPRAKRPTSDDNGSSSRSSPRSSRGIRAREPLMRHSLT